MSWWEILIIITAVLYVGLVIFLHFYLKRKGKSLIKDCGDCSKCHGQCKIDCQKILEEYHKENTL